MNKNLFALLVIGFLSLTACQPRPKIINHPQPGLSIDFSPFTDAGCPEDEYGRRACASDSPLAALGCDEIQEPSNLLGGLSPSHPVAFCIIHFTPPDGVTTEIEAEIKNGLFFFASGGLFPQYYRYVIYQNNGFVLLKTEEEFRNLYAPIESSDEALSYVLAVKLLEAYFDIEKNPAYEYEVDMLEDTHVISEGDGYRLNMYYYQVFGCGPHWTYAVNIHLASDGTLQEISVTRFFVTRTKMGCVWIKFKGAPKSRKSILYRTNGKSEPPRRQERQENH